MRALSVLSLKDNKLGTKEAGKVLGEMLKGNSVLKELDLSKNSVQKSDGGDAPGFAQGISTGLAGNGSLTSLDINNNNLGELVLPDGWTIDRNGYNKRGKAKWIYKHSDGREQKKQHPGKPEGIIAIADAIPDMGAISSVNVLGNFIGVEQAQELIKILHTTEKLITLCGFIGDETELNLSKKNLGNGCGVLVANEISDMGALTKLMFGDKLVVTMTTEMTEVNFSGKLRPYEAQIVAAFLPKCT
jgi:hypothetical protein